TIVVLVLDYLAPTRVRRQGRRRLLRYRIEDSVMRVGVFSVEVVPHREGRVRELESGHVLARPGQVYRLRLRNHGPLRAVAEIGIEGKPITDSGLVLRPWSVMELERPVRDGEHGRFTVISEGNERVFGPDGGRDNESLGVIRSAFRRARPHNAAQNTRPHS